MLENEPRPITILIGALGGEGGGLLTNWLVAAAAAADLPVQSTSIPGVAQRTGATTYYLEVFPTETAELNGKMPVMSLYPGPGNMDVVVASELLEAGRAIENGFVSPDRTTLIASTHRIYAIAEKSAMGDGVHDSDRVLAAAREMADSAMLHDLAKTAEANGTALNAVLLGMIAGSGKLPLPDSAYEDAIRAQGVAVDANLRGFAAGLSLARDTEEPKAEAVETAPPEQRIELDFPAPVAEFAAHGVSKLADYQDMRYARLYLDRLQTVLAVDSQQKSWKLTREVARYLALWMSYEDVIRVADLKTRADRYNRVRAEVGAKADEPVRVTEFLKPGVEEVASLLPPGLGAALSGWAARRGLTARLHVARRVRTDTIFGFLQLWLLAKLRFWRRRTYRFSQEQALMEKWLAALVALAPRDYAFAVELAECANLLKGYGETQARGHGNFEQVFDTIVAPALGGAATDAARLRSAREAALADPEGQALGQALAV
ncbi:MAG: indolepyruvate oxidoreductase subunit beta family protein [Alphaproteobacteria bacterium]|nr:indolepyruvate oxidoreductase subunit beta family protein [Alphaproteobacteria bacterium]